jgi:hypothetical protein
MALKPVPSIDLESLPGGGAIAHRDPRGARARNRAAGTRESPVAGNAPAGERLKKYGPKSEKLSNEQIELLELEPGVHAQEVEKEAEVCSGRKRLPKREHAGRNALPGHLPRREEIIAVEGEEGFCTCCGEERGRIGYDEKEVLDLEPARYFVRVIKREKLACRKCPEGKVVTAAAGGPKIVEKSKLSDAGGYQKVCVRVIPEIEAK